MIEKIFLSVEHDLFAKVKKHLRDFHSYPLKFMGKLIEKNEEEKQCFKHSLSVIEVFIHEKITLSTRLPLVDSYELLWDTASALETDRFPQTCQG